MGRREEGVKPSSLHTLCTQRAMLLVLLILFLLPTSERLSWLTSGWNCGALYPIKSEGPLWKLQFYHGGRSKHANSSFISVISFFLFLFSNIDRKFVIYSFFPMGVQHVRQHWSSNVLACTSCHHLSSPEQWRLNIEYAFQYWRL